MPRNNLRELTLELIQENELPKRKILEGIRKKSGRSVSDKTLNEILMNLLKEERFILQDMILMFTMG